MNKKILIALIAVIGFSITAFAGDKYMHDASALPKGAQTTLSKNFKSKVSIVKIDKSIVGVSEYEVVMSDGSEVTFDKDGNWKEVEVNISKSVPSGFIPANISNYVKSNYKGKRIVGIEKTRGGYDIDLSNGVEMKFDKQGNFLKFDN